MLSIVVAGVELQLDGIFSSRLAATALYTTSPSVAYLRIDLRIHHNDKSTARHLSPIPRGLRVQCSYLLCATFRVAYGNDITGLFAAPLRDLLRRHACCYPRMKALSFEQTLRSRTTINHKALIGGRQLLITAGHCAEFVYKESEDLADLQAITPPSEQHHRLHLSLWSISKKSAKSLTKTI